MTMKRRILIIVLGLGTIAGFGSGIASAVHHHRAHRAAFERHVADLCTDAAEHHAARRAAELRDEARPVE
jgi:hypothetical protein